MLRAVLIGTIVLGAIVPRASAQDTGDGGTIDRSARRIVQGQTIPGYWVALGGRAGGVLCAPHCELTAHSGDRVEVGLARDDADVAWQLSLELDHHDWRIDIVLEDRSAYRTVADSLLAAAGILLAATAIVGIATEPERPDMGWFGERHGLVFAGIAGGVVLAFGVPGVALAVAFESDAPAVRAVPMDAIPADDG